MGWAAVTALASVRVVDARAAALARLAGSDGIRAPESRLAHAFAGSGGSSSSGGRSLWTNARLWLGIAIIVAAGFGYQQWQVYQQVSDIVELDAQILSSDLPIDAYLDQGFRNWLAHDEN